jgi:hypothetical protein
LFNEFKLFELDIDFLSIFNELFKFVDVLIEEFFVELLLFFIYVDKDGSIEDNFGKNNLCVSKFIKPLNYNIFIFGTFISG